MSSHHALLALVCATFGLLVAPWLTRSARDLISRRTPEGVAPRPVGYPIVAGATAFSFAATALHFGPSWQLPAYLLLATLLVVLSVVDLATKTLPRRLVHLALVGGVALLAPVGALSGEPERLLWATTGAIAAFVTLTALHVAARGGFGFGDVRLGAVLGWYLAWQGLWSLVAGLFLAFTLSALTGLALMAVGRAGRRTAIPFGPFLAIGAILALVGAPPIVTGA